jgi:drug/metabolite transporter (DMT)-like permease
VRTTTKFSWSDAGLVATILFWAANMSIVKNAFGEIAPTAFNSVRFLFTPILMLSIVFILERSVRIDRTLWRDAILLGLIGNTGYQIFFIEGLNLTSAASASLLVATTPIWVAIISHVRGWERLSLISWVGIGLSFVGVFIILFDGEVLSSSAMIGDVLVLIASMCWAYYTIGAKALLAKYSAIRVTAVTLSIGSIPIILFGLPQIIQVSWGTLTWVSWGSMAYSVIFSIAIAYVLWYNGVVKVGPTRTGIYASLLPACGVISAYLILGDPITVRDIAGTIAIVTGLLLTRRG